MLFYFMSKPYPTTAINVPAIISTATALAANPLRIGWQIQNLSTNALFVCLGPNASTTVFHIVLKAQKI